MFKLSQNEVIENILRKKHDAHKREVHLSWMQPTMVYWKIDATTKKRGATKQENAGTSH